MLEPPCAAHACASKGALVGYSTGGGQYCPTQGDTQGDSTVQPQPLTKSLSLSQSCTLTHTRWATWGITDPFGTDQSDRCPSHDLGTCHYL